MRVGDGDGLSYVKSQLNQVKCPAAENISVLRTTSCFYSKSDKKERKFGTLTEFLGSFSLIWESLFGARDRDPSRLDQVPTI